MDKKTYKSTVKLLKKIHNDANIFLQKDNKEEYYKCGIIIDQILHSIENDYGIKEVIKIIIKIKKDIGQTLNPINISMLQKLVNNGFEVKATHNVLMYQK